MHRRVLLLVLLSVFSLVAACAHDSEKPSPPGKAGYVALGDSYVSGPMIAPVDSKSPYCLRSTNNYPSLVARSLKPAAFIDVSCGGETTEMMESPRKFAKGTSIVAPQLDVVGRNTSLVTLGIGGNDGGGSANLFKHCLISATANESHCREFVSDYMPHVFSQTRDRVVKLLATIKKRAPGARVVLVGYLRIAPEKGSCAVLPMADGTRSATLAWERQMDKTLQSAAKKAKVDFVDVRKASLGHDVCAGDQAWVNGLENPPGNGAFLHPKEAGMRAVADEVLKVLNE